MVQPVISDVKDAKIIGLLFQRYRGNLSPTLARRLWKEELYKMAEEKGWDGSQPFLIIQLPCGESVTYQTFEDVPIVNVPCTCGNPQHWFIKFEWFKRENNAWREEE